MESKRMSEEKLWCEKKWYENYPLHYLWANSMFPLCPLFEYRKYDEYNESNISFHWLCFRFWTMSNFAFEFDIVLNFDRIGFGFVLPYLRIWIGVTSLYTRPTMFLQRLFSRSVNYGTFARTTTQNLEEENKNDRI